MGVSIDGKDKQTASGGFSKRKVILLSVSLLCLIGLCAGIRLYRDWSEAEAEQQRIHAIYNNGLELMQVGNFADAIDQFLLIEEELEEASQQIQLCAWEQARLCETQGEWLQAAHYYMMVDGEEAFQRFREISWAVDDIHALMGTSNRMEGVVYIRQDGTASVQYRNISLSSAKLEAAQEVQEWSEVDQIAVLSGSEMVAMRQDGSLLFTSNCSPDWVQTFSEADVESLLRIDNIVYGLSSGPLVYKRRSVGGRISAADTTWEDIVDIACNRTNGYWLIGLRRDGTVKIQIKSRDNMGEEAADWSDLVQVGAGDRLFVGLRSDGTVVAAGTNTHGQCEVDDWRDVIDIQVNISSVYALAADGHVYVSGSASNRQIQKWDNVVRVEYGPGGVFGLRSDGTVYFSGNDEDIASRVSNWSDVVSLQSYHTSSNLTIVALRSDGSIRYISGMIYKPVSTSGIDLSDIRISM